MENKILLIEKNKGGLKLFVPVLRQHNYKTVTTRGAESGIQAAAKALPDLILLEVDSPNDNAINALISLTSNPFTRNIPIVVCSERTNRAAINASFHAGAAWAVTMPFTAGELLKIVGFCLSPSSTSARMACDPCGARIGRFDGSKR